MKEGAIRALGETWGRIKEAECVCTGYSTFTGLKEKLGFQQEQEGCEKSEATLLTGAVPAPAIMATPPLPAVASPRGPSAGATGKSRMGWERGRFLQERTPSPERLSHTPPGSHQVIRGHQGRAGFPGTPAGLQTSFDQPLRKQRPMCASLGLLPVSWAPGQPLSTFPGTS